MSQSSRPRGQKAMGVVRDRRYLLCGRPGCLEPIADVDVDVWDPDLSGQWVHVAHLRGSGWHSGTDGVWRLEGHARRRVSRGKRPAPAHPRTGTVFEFRQPVGGHPYALDLVEEFARLPSDATRLSLRGGPRSTLSPGERVSCGRCGSISTIEAASLAPTDDVVARLKDASRIR